MVGDYGQIIIKEKKELLKEIATMLPFTSIHLIGPSGSGKTTIVENLMNMKELGIDELKILRLQGVSSEDFRLPIVKTIKKKDELFGNEDKEEKTVELINMGVFQEIIDNPQKTYLLFLDEILRSDSSIAPLLFGILEGRINGIKAPNLRVVCASNYGEQYITNFDFSDSALRRRQIFIEYIPCKEDIIDFIKEKNYNNILTECMELLPMSDIVNHDKASKELEQDTQLGSWNLLNNRWNKLGINSYDEGRNDISSYGEYFFNTKTKSALLNKLVLLKQLQEIDIHKEIIQGKGLEEGKEIKNKKGKVIDKEEMLTELKIRTKTFILNETLTKEKNYLLDNLKDILFVFRNDQILAVSLISDLKSKIKIMSEKDSSISNKLMSKFLDIIDRIGDMVDSKDEEYSKLCQEIMDSANLKAN